MGYKVVLKSNTHLISDFIESALFRILIFGCISPMGNSYVLNFQKHIKLVRKTSVEGGYASQRVKSRVYVRM